MKANATFEEAIATLDDDKKRLASGLHERALTLGYIPFITKVGKSESTHEIEYKANKKAYVLFISRISKNELSVGCKLLHLGEYTNLIDGLGATVRNELLASRPCKVTKGCVAYIRFSYENKEYFTCRHAMRLKTLTYHDLQSFWSLLESEASQRASDTMTPNLPQS